jgi:hypothetical protein
MMVSGDWRIRVRRELARGEQAAHEGNEGMARVCARRAAGWTVQAYLEAQGLEAARPSALEQIKFLRTQAGLDDETREVLEHMILHLAKDEPEDEPYWPLDANLLEEARWLAGRLFADFEV